MVSSTLINGSPHTESPVPEWLATSVEFMPDSAANSDMQATNCNKTAPWRTCIEIVRKVRDLWSSRFCQIQDYFGCQELDVAFFRNAMIYCTFTLAVNLQSAVQYVTDRDGTRHKKNLADPLALAYARDNLKESERYLVLNATSKYFDNVADGNFLECDFTSPVSRDMVLTVLTSPIPFEACNAIKIALTSVVIEAISDGERQAGKVYFLFFLTLLALVPMYHIDKRCCGGKIKRAIAKILDPIC